MNVEHLLDAIGLLDDDLVQKAERYRHSRPKNPYKTWLSWVACFAVALVLGYGITHLKAGGGTSTAPDQFNGGTAGGTPSASVTSDGCAPGDSYAGEEMPSTENGNSVSGETPEPDAPGAPLGGELCPAIMVDGVLYQSTGRQVPAEPDPGAVQTVVSYTSGTPEMDGQTNFSQDLSAQYAMTGLGLAVLIDGEWTLFEPIP